MAFMMHTIEVSIKLLAIKETLIATCHIRVSSMRNSMFSRKNGKLPHPFAEIIKQGVSGPLPQKSIKKQLINFISHARPTHSIKYARSSPAGTYIS